MTISYLCNYFSGLSSYNYRRQTKALNIDDQKSQSIVTMCREGIRLSPERDRKTEFCSPDFRKGDAYEKETGQQKNQVT